jgi:hypothetical protein
VKTPASGRQPRLGELSGIQRDDGVSYRPFGSAELRTLVPDDLAVLLTEALRGIGASGSRAAIESYRPLPRPATRLIGRDEDVARWDLS